MTTTELTPTQADAIAALEAGENVFLTGPAGTGKSYLLNRWLGAMPHGRRAGVAITASTGIAAYAIGGRTINSWIGYGIGQRRADDLSRDFRWEKWAAPRIKRATALVIDEISMVNANAFNDFYRICGMARGREDEPFGGLQVVVVGDFGQLPPIKRGGEKVDFAFLAHAWRMSKFRVFELRDVKRQSSESDAAFIAALAEARIGRLSEGSLALFQSRVDAYDPDVPPQAVRVVTKNFQVDQINGAHLRSLSGPSREYEAVETGKDAPLKKLDDDCLSPRVLELKIGARVMFTRNDKQGRYHNGTLGTVVGWKELPVRSLLSELESAIVVRLDNGNAVDVKTETWEVRDDADVLSASRRQFPLRLAFAITAHKSQGMSIDRVSVDLSETFSDGQGYVAVSRARSLAGLNIEGWKGRETFTSDPQFRRFAQHNLKEVSK